VIYIVAQAQAPSIDDILKKIRETLETSLKEAENISRSAQQSLQNMARLSEELKKLSEELRKPPASSSSTAKASTR
jgi:regulator of replication initiation timing